MKLGISSYTYPWEAGTGDEHPPAPLTPDMLLARAQALGVRVIQLADGLALDTFSPAALADYRARASAAGITLEVGTRGADAAHVARYIDISRQLGASLLRLVTRTPAGSLPPADTAALLRALLPDLERAGVTLALETYEGLSAQDFLAIMRAINSPHAGIVYDTANSLGRFESPRAVFETLREHIVNFHAKDVAARRHPSGMGFVIDGTPAGGGMIDLGGLIAAARGLPHDVNVILEHWLPAIGTIEERVQTEGRWAAQSVAWLRRHVAE